MAADQFGRLIKFLRFINFKTFKLKIFTYPDLIRIKIQVLLFFVSPSLSRIFSRKNSKLPTKDEKFNKSENVLDNIIVFDNDLKFDEVNIFLRGYGKDFTKFKHKKNCMLVNYSFLEDESISESSNYHGKRNLFQGPEGFLNVVSGNEIDECMEKNIPFICLQSYQLYNGKPVLNPKEIERNKILENYFKKNNNCKRIKFYFNSSCRTIRSGSGIHSALVFSKLSKKVNIYGWNFYLNNISKNLSIFALYNLLSPKSFVQSRQNHFEYTLCTLAFVRRLLDLKHVKIEGHIKDFCIFYPKIVNKALNLFFK